MAKYFGDGLGYEFLRYFLLFRSSVHFSEHVGIMCSERWVKRMKSRLLRLESVHSKARQEMDIEKLADIEMGRFELK